MNELTLRFASLLPIPQEHFLLLQGGKTMLTFRRGALRKGILFMEDLFCAQLSDYLTVGIWEKYVL